MRGISLQRCFVLATVAVAAASLTACTRSKQEVAAEHDQTVSRYCGDCHSLAEQEGGLVLEHPNLLDPAAQRAKWEKVIKKLGAGLMPPPGEPRPSHEAMTSLVSYLETNLDATAPEPPGAPIRRLNRSAYGNAVRDLLGFPIDADSMLPAEIASDGFDNISDTLKTSSLWLERYLTVGLRVADILKHDVGHAVGIYVDVGIARHERTREIIGVQ